MFTPFKNERNSCMKIKPSKKAGFTLLEIMVVVGIIGVLAPIAIPTFIKARSTTRTNTCINSLRQIDYAKQIWATETLQGPAAVANSDDLLPYLGRGGGSIDNLFCPLDPGRSFDSSYSIGNVLTAPVCNLDGADHALL